MSIEKLVDNLRQSERFRPYLESIAFTLESQEIPEVEIKRALNYIVKTTEKEEYKGYSEEVFRLFDKILNNIREENREYNQREVSSIFLERWPSCLRSLSRKDPLTRNSDGLGGGKRTYAQAVKLGKTSGG